MPELEEQMYCSQQIVIPPKFPYILKRFCKAAIKTQPYDILRWSFEYFKALSEKRPPPVKLRLEYPVYSTEGGLTRGCLKVIAKQLQGTKDLPLHVVQKAWRGFCLDPAELKRILCLCEVYSRHDYVPFLHFIAVAAGLLTKNLTYTMILLCETLTNEPDGGSAAILADDFLKMYLFLARMDASKDVKYCDGYREGETPKIEEEEVTEEESVSQITAEESMDDFWLDSGNIRHLNLVDDSITMAAKLSYRAGMPTIGPVERSPSVERAAMIERESYMRERKDRAMLDEDVEAMMLQMNTAKQPAKEPQETDKEIEAEEVEEFKPIRVWDEDDNELPLEIYGEPKEHDEEEAGGEGEEEGHEHIPDEEVKQDEAKNEETEAEKSVHDLIAELYAKREARREDLEQTFQDLARIVNRFHCANYDLGMVAGRQMSVTSGEFVAQHIEKKIMDYIDDQIAVLPDPDLKKKKAKPEEVAMVRDLLYNFLDENMDVFVPEEEAVEEEEKSIPDIIIVYAVPGIGPPVPEAYIDDVEEYVADMSKIQAEMFMPRNLRHFLCPPLQKYEEYNYDDFKNKEELACAGVFTD